MGFLSRLFDDASAAPRVADAPVRDDIPSLISTTQSVVLEVNRSAGELPPVGVVLARTVTDAVTQVLTSPDAETNLDIHTRVAINAVLTDYLPATLRTYVQAARVARPGELDQAQDSLVEQLLTLRHTVEQIADAARDRDVSAQRVHGRFLQDKFASGTELQL